MNDETPTDPFEDLHQMLAADQVIGSPGSLPGQYQRPRDLAIAADGSLYVVDSDNHRIQHISPDGSPLHVWGVFGDVNSGRRISQPSIVPEPATVLAH